MRHARRVCPLLPGQAVAYLLQKIYDVAFQPMLVGSRVAFLSIAIVAWVILRVDVLEAKGPNCRHLRDVLTGSRPVEVGRIARQNDHAARRIS
jgi:hypothetical protein